MVRDGRRVGWTDSEEIASSARRRGFSVCEVTEPTTEHGFRMAYERYAERVGTVGRIFSIVAALALVVGCNGKTAGDVKAFVPVIAESFLPLDDYATALCDRAAACGAPFVESVQIAQDEQAGPGAPLDRPSTADGDCPERLAAWMRTQPKASDECFTAMAATIRAHGCAVEPGIPACCEGAGGGR